MKHNKTEDMEETEVKKRGYYSEIVTGKWSKIDTQWSQAKSFKLVNYKMYLIK